VTEPGLAERIRQHLPHLSPAERKVALALLSGPATAGLASSARLAQMTGVSGPTVSRFAAHLGFENYAAFQDALRADLAARVMAPIDVYREQITKDGDPLAVAGDALSRAVERSIKGLLPEDFARASAMLSDRRAQVMITGGRYSHLLAAYLATRLREFRGRVRMVEPIAGERAAAVSDLTRRDVVVAFDFRRYERDTVEFARVAATVGARVILLTDPWLSPIVDTAEVILPAQVDGPGPFESLVPTLAVVETLVTSVARELGHDGDDRFERFGRTVDLWLAHSPGNAADVGSA
jgi:DNA-binding MurR/RpiR family transcriptional regulator